MYDFLILGQLKMFYYSNMKLKLKVFTQSIQGIWWMYLHKLNTDKWNEFMLKSLPGDTSICVAHDSKCNEMLSHYTILLPNSSSFILGTTITQFCSVSI